MEQKVESRGRNRQGQIVERIERHVCEHLTENITLRSVAAHCGVSVSTITQSFQKHRGITFHRYLTGKRMEAAEELIRQGTALEEVGRLVGYTEHSTFYRAFSRHFGICPREFRKNCRREAAAK